MPNRIIRDGLLDSESWLGLKNNDDRVCWITLFLKADVFGNQPAGLLRIVHLCRFAGIDTTEKAAKVLENLADFDLVRTYQVEGKPYVHIPRYQQSLRYLGKVWPLSPWNTIEEKQRLTKKPQEDSESITGGLMHVVDVDVEVDVDKKQKALSGRPDPAKPDFSNQAIEILDYLNKNTNRSYRAIPTNLKLIEARLKSGVTPLQMREVIFDKCQQWGSDPNMFDYLRPKTLFNATNFENYLGKINAMP